MTSSDMRSSVRVRFAPSPTGMPHLGSLRTALFNFLYARHEGGAFLLRIEDTDRERSRPEYLDAMMHMLRWVRMEPDGPVMVQSERLSVYHQVAHELIAQGKAYRCDCSLQELQERVMQTNTEGAQYGKYDGRCRTRQVDASQPHVIRFAIPDDVHEVRVPDAIRGELVFMRDALDDFIIIRSDGGPMYNFAVVVDDMAMAITHIIRGEEHLVNTPKQILLYQALHAQVPVFAHLPLILGPDGSKLSKRDAAADALEYIRQGYVPEALVNYMVRLGWAHGDDELFFDRDHLASLFTLQGVTHKGALFDWKKLDWVNQQHILRMDMQEILTYMKTWMDIDLEQYCHQWGHDRLVAALKLYVPRVHTLKQVADLVMELYDGPRSYEIPILESSLMPVFETLEHELMSYGTITSSDVQQILKTKLGVPLGTVGPSIRVALTGRLAAPGIGDLVALLGTPESIRRLHAYRTTLQ